MRIKGDSGTQISELSIKHRLPNTKYPQQATMAATPTDPTYIVNGRKEDSAVFPRRDIHDLQANAPEQFSLFILALTAVQYPTAGVPLLPPTFKAQGLVPEGGYWYNLGPYLLPLSYCGTDTQPPLRRHSRYSVLALRVSPPLAGEVQSHGHQWRPTFW